MNIMWQAIRAATIETLGVVLVVGLLFGAPALGLQHAVGSRFETSVLWDWWKSLQDGFQGNLSATPLPQRSTDYTEQRLDHYSSLYRSALSDYASRVVGKIAAGLPDMAARRAENRWDEPSRAM